MKTFLHAGLGLFLLGGMGICMAQETPAALPPPQAKPGAEDEIRQQTAWRLFLGENFDLFFGNGTPRPQPPLPGPQPDAFSAFPVGRSDGIANELEFIEHLWSENDMVDEYKTLAKRSYLSEADQVLFVRSAYSSLDFDRNISEVLIALIGNPCFSEGARDAILEGMNAGKIWDSSRRRKIFEALENRGQPLPSPRDPQRWIGYHFSRFQRAIDELTSKSAEYERRLVELEKRTRELAEFDRRIVALERRPIPPAFDFSGFDKRLGSLEKRTEQADEYGKRITVLEGRIQVPADLEKRITALEKAVQTRTRPAPPQPEPSADVEKQLAELQAKVKILEAEMKKLTAQPRTIDRKLEKAPD